MTVGIDKATLYGLTLSVASGKGGTGKTTVAAALAMVYSSEGLMVRLLDCDVDEPNLNLQLESSLLTSYPVRSLKPSLEQNLCDLCGACERACRFNAIIVGKSRLTLMEGMCHSCGGCVLACPTGALKDAEKRIGHVETYAVREDISLVSGRSEIQETALARIVRNVRKHADESMLNIVDSPPGTSCALVAAVEGSDFCVIVTEPTEYGLSDMTQLVEALDKLEVPYGVLANKAGTGPIDMRAFCEEHGICFIGEIPFFAGFYDTTSRRDWFDDLPQEIRDGYRSAAAKIMKECV